MCARYLLEVNDAHIRAWLQVVESSPWEPPMDLRPTDSAPVIVHSRRRNGLMITPMRFGLVPSWSKSRQAPRALFNARCETAEVKPAFREAASRRHALVPATAFVEWSGEPKKRVPNRVTDNESDSPLLLAGLWESWTDPDDAGAEPLRSFTILTTRAVGPLVQIHDRMPVLVSLEHAPGWLQCDVGVAELIPPSDMLAERLSLTPF
jgi:putative SOS response-associated peptidase YedK